MECRPPLPICAEGGGGKQLLGSKGHCLAQKVRPTLPAGLPAWPPPHPQIPMEREGGKAWGEKG